MQQFWKPIMKRLLLAILLTTVTAPAAPRVSAGLGYYAILPDKLLLTSMVTAEGTDRVECLWSKVSGPGEVVFERADAPTTWAKATVPGTYVFKLSARQGMETAETTTTVNIYDTPGRYGNPILPGMFPDPHIFEEDGQFYI